MQISTAYETRAYPEIYLWFITETEPEPMDLLSLKASSGNKDPSIELGSNRNLSPKGFWKLDFELSDNVHVCIGSDGVSVCCRPKGDC